MKNQTILEKMRGTATDWQEHRDTLRQLLGASDAEPHRLPEWMRRRIASRLELSPSHTDTLLFMAAADRAGGPDVLLAPWGMSRVAGGWPLFIMEPHQLDDAAIGFIRRLAALLGLTWRVSPAAWFAPGRAVRVEFTTAEANGG